MPRHFDLYFYHHGVIVIYYENSYLVFFLSSPYSKGHIMLFCPHIPCPRLSDPLLTVCVLGVCVLHQALQEVGVVIKGYWCVKRWPAPWHGHLYEVGMLLAIFLLPLIIMTFAYVSICRELVRVSSKKGAFKGER